MNKKIKDKKKSSNNILNNSLLFGLGSSFKLDGDNAPSNRAKTREQGKKNPSDIK